MRNTLNITLLAMLAICGLPTGAGAGNVASPAAAANLTTSFGDAEGIAFFEKRIRPVLSQQCYKCHSSTSEKLKGSLRLDSRDAVLQGGETGPAVVPGHPEKSLMIEAVNYTNDDMKMPPKNRLPANVVADLTKWVQMGAPWPAEAAAAGVHPGAVAPNPSANYDKLRKEHWAWQPVVDSPPPAVKNPGWALNDVDRYVLAMLDAKGLKPVADANPAALIRRVTFDLTGLPPTPEEVASFVADKSPDAYERRVDRLLASGAFGERWGRHWLDIARFAESAGSSRNVPYNHAWRYRDYVIDSLNKDKPYSRFVSEQIAGDLMPYNSPEEHNEQISATGFLAIGVKDLNEKDHLKYVMDNVDEQIDVTTRSIMALTVACARCHDHKFDPIPTTDYYALAGIFKSTEILAGVESRKKAGAKKDYSAPAELYRLDNAAGASPPALARGNSPVAPARQLNALQSRKATLEAQLAKTSPDDKAARKAARQELRAVNAELSASQSGGTTPAVEIADTPPPGGFAMGVRDGQPADTSVCLHGEPHDPGQSVPRGFVSVVPVHSTAGIDTSHSGRLQLAQWLTSTDNPLTPRVMVNRMWAHLFGEGIVRTVDNFGSTGEEPADPKLLDHLASQFMQNKWSIKYMVREMVLSHAYRLSTANSAEAFVVDPDDRLVWRMASRRLDAEEIRDAMLAAGGKLDLSHPRGSLAAALPVAELKNVRIADQAARSDCRSVYLPILRDLVPPVLDLFDFAEPTMVIGSRDTTTVATQALYLMNDPFVIEQSHNFAMRVQNATGLDDGGRVDLAYRIALSRSATPAERARGVAYVNGIQHDVQTATRDSLKASRTDALASFCQALLAGAEFRYLN